MNLVLDIETEVVTVASVKEAMEILEVFEIATAELRDGCVIHTLGWTKWSDKPVIVESRKLDMFHR